MQVGSDECQQSDIHLGTATAASTAVALLRASDLLPPVLPDALVAFFITPAWRRLIALRCCRRAKEAYHEQTKRAVNAVVATFGVAGSAGARQCLAHHVDARPD